MAKYRVAVIGTVGKSVLIDDSLSSRVAKLETQIATTGGVTRHSALTGLQQGDDHPQYTMWAAPETIKALWNFQTIPYIQGETLAEYIEDVVAGGSDPFIADSPSVTWTYDDTGNHLQADVVDEYVEDLVGSMLVNTTYIDLDYGDSDGSIKAILDTGAVLDLVGSQLQDSSTIDFTYDSGTKRTSAAVVQSATYNWTGDHTFAPASGNTKVHAGNLQLDVDNLELQLGASQDLRLYHDGANSNVRNDTGLLRFYLNSATQNAMFTSNTYFYITSSSETNNLISERMMKVLVAGTPSAPTFKGFSYGSTGSRSSPAALSADDGIFALDAGGYDGAAFSARAFIRGFAAEAWSTTAHGTYYQFGTCATGVVAARSVMGVWSNGGVRLMLDNAELSLGAGSSTSNNSSGDLRLYHDGTNSIVRTDTGGLRLQFSTNNRFEVNTTGVGFNGATPIARPDYTVTNPTTNRSIDVSTITHAQLAQVVGTLIQDFINYGLYQ